MDLTLIWVDAHLDGVDNLSHRVRLDETAFWLRWKLSDPPAPLRLCDQIAGDKKKPLPTSPSEPWSNSKCRRIPRPH